MMSVGVRFPDHRNALAFLSFSSMLKEIDTKRMNKGAHSRAQSSPFGNKAPLPQA
jgi:hypothetical protein